MRVYAHAWTMNVEICSIALGCKINAEVEATGL